MIKHELYSSNYLEWMCRLVSDQTFKSDNYTRLMNHLNRFPFIFRMSMDGNRAADGVDLRGRFEDNTGLIADPVLVAFFGSCSCSVMEMITALALRCEETIMSDDLEGDRTGLWFWNMIQSLGLYSMDDRSFDECYVNDILSKWMNREFQPNGEGGLFTVINCNCDLRTVEIWEQMNWYLETLMYEREGQS